MIQSIQTDVLVGIGIKELSIEYSEDDDLVYIYLDNTLMCSTSYEDNFKELVKKMIEKW